MIFSALFEILSLFDLFAIIPSFRLSFNNRGTYSTAITKFISMIVIALSIFAFISFGSNMIYRKRNQTIVSEVTISNPPSIPLSKENFFFAFSLNSAATNFAKFTDPRYYSVSSILFIKEKDKFSAKPLDIGLCDSSDVPSAPHLQEYFQINTMNDMFCIKNYTDVFMQGRWDSSFFQDIEISIRVCKNSTSNPIKCASEAELNKMFAEAYFTSSIPDGLVDPNNFEKPGEIKAYNYYDRIGLKSSLSVEMNYQITQITTDEGYLYEDDRTDQLLVQSHQKRMYSPIDAMSNSTDNDLLFKIFVRYDATQKNYFRKYDKIPEVLAQTGGIIKLLIIVCALILKPVLNFYFYQDLAHEIFDFEDNSGNNIKKIGFFEMMYGTFRRNSHYLNQAKHLISVGNKEITKKLDLVTIMKKFSELEKLKFLVLSKEQLENFEHLPKPKIGGIEEVNSPRSTYNKLFTKTPHKTSDEPFFKDQNQKSILESKFFGSVNVQQVSVSQKTMKKTIFPGEIEMEEEIIKKFDDENVEVKNIPDFDTKLEKK